MQSQTLTIEGREVTFTEQADGTWGYDLDANGKVRFLTDLTEGSLRKVAGMIQNRRNRWQW